MRSIRVRLALIFSSITLTAIAGIYLYVAPQLESRLREEKLSALSRDAGLYSRDLVRAIGTNVDEAAVNRSVRQAADRSGARVTLLGVSRGSQGLQTYPISDSTAETKIEDADVGVRDVSEEHAVAQAVPAIALEPQMFPDTPNRPEFGSVRLAPGETYRNLIVWRFSAA